MSSIYLSTTAYSTRRTIRRSCFRLLRPRNTSLHNCPTLRGICSLHAPLLLERPLHNGSSESYALHGSTSFNKLRNITIQKKLVLTKICNCQKWFKSSELFSLWYVLRRSVAKPLDDIQDRPLTSLKDAQDLNYKTMWDEGEVVQITTRMIRF
jgi:hypothetical protein